MAESIYSKYTPRASRRMLQVARPAGQSFLLGKRGVREQDGCLNAGTPPWNREHPPTEASRPSAHGPVGVELGLRPLSWHGVRARAGTPEPCLASSAAGQTLVVGLSPISIGPDAPRAAPGFRGSALLCGWSPVAMFSDVGQRMLRNRMLVSLFRYWVGS